MIKFKTVRSFKQSVKVVCVLLFVGFFAACSDNNDSITGSKTLDLKTADVALSLDMTNAPSAVVRVVATLSRTGDSTRTIDLALGSNAASGTFSAVREGTWLLKVDALDNASVVLYTGQTPVDVFNGQVTNVSLVLTPTGGIVNVSVTWGNVPAPIIETFATGFDSPNGLAFDKAGNLYVSNRASGLINRVHPSGTVSLFTTDVSGPTQIEFDSSGYLYIVNGYDNTLKRISPNGIIDTVMTGFDNPTDLTFDRHGNIYVCNYNSGIVHKITPDGTRTIFASGFNGPVAVIMDKDDNLYVGSRFTNDVVKVSQAGTRSTFATNVATPHSFTFDAFGNLYASEASATSGNRIFKITASGLVSVAVSGLSWPTGIVFDNNGKLYVANYGGTTVSRITF